MANPVDIVDIITVPALIKDSFIKAGNVMLDDDVIPSPIHYVGGFAIVFPFVVNQEKWAFRCWYNDVGKIGNRLKVLSKELEKVNLPYFCNLKYEDEGIVIDGEICPTTRMRWVDGLNIKEYICKNSQNKEKLFNLANKFKSLCLDLYRHNISHGDLQHGNILIDGNDNIYLIDYDSIYLPALKGEPDFISGLPSYQHPNRKNNKNANEKVDFFSELVIYISILAFALDSSLIKEFNFENSDNMIFSQNDYIDITHTKAYKKLSVLSPEIRSLLAILEGYLIEKDINRLIPFWIIGSNSKYCINCGKEFFDIMDNYCIFCGAKRI